MSRPLRFGVFMQPVHDPAENPTLALDRDLDLLVHLDRLGFHEAWIGEHHSTGWETIASPAVFVATAAERTRHIRLGSGIVPLPLHHPLIVADEWVLLDHLTRGRVMLGVGPGGGLPSDPLVFGLDPAAQSGRFAEAFDTLMRLLTDPEPLTEDRGWYRLVDATLQLRPFSHPHMEIGIVTGTNAESLARIGAHGTRWLVGTSTDRFDEAWTHVERAAEAAGRSADRSVATLPITVHLAASRTEALDQVRRGSARERYDFSVPVTGAPRPGVDRDAWIEELAGRENVVIGTPDDAIDKIGSLVERTGAGGVLLTTKEWADRRAILDSYEMFARQVVPALTGSNRGPQLAAQAAQRLVGGGEEGCGAGGCC